MKSTFLAVMLALVPGVTFAATTVAIHPEPGFYLHEQGGAVLRTVPGGTEVIVHVSGVPHGANEPMHIHEGHCGHINPNPSWALSPLSDSGVSKTLVPVPLAMLEAKPYAINIHKSARDLAVYVACGNIPASTK